MSKNRNTRTSSLVLALRKLFVSGFVIISFVGYALHDRVANTDSTSRDVNLPEDNNGQAQLLSGSSQPLPTVRPAVPTSEFLAPTATSSPEATQAPTDKSQGQYVDGVYTGPVTNAFYGLVQVEATIKDGWLQDVQFLRYPNDRRTSRRINSVAMPRLIQESIQLQSARVHIVSGATLTSEAFAQSLYNVLNNALR